MKSNLLCFCLCLSLFGCVLAPLKNQDHQNTEVDINIEGRGFSLIKNSMEKNAISETEMENLHYPELNGVKTNYHYVDIKSSIRSCKPHDYFSQFEHTS